MLEPKAKKLAAFFADALEDITGGAEEKSEDNKAKIRLLIKKLKAETNDLSKVSKPDLNALYAATDKSLDIIQNGFKATYPQLKTIAGSGGFVSRQRRLELRAMLGDSVELALSELGENLNDTLQKNLEGEVEFGATMKTLRDYVTTFSDYETSRFYRLAITEATAVAGASTYFASEDLKALGVEVTEFQWVTESDDRVRTEHAAMNGVRVKYGEKFKVGSTELLYPADQSNILGKENGKDRLNAMKQAANCRCDIVPII